MRLVGMYETVIVDLRVDRVGVSRSVHKMKRTKSVLQDQNVDLKGVNHSDASPMQRQLQIMIK